MNPTDRLASLRSGFHAVVLEHGPILIEPAMPVCVYLRPEGEPLGLPPVAVEWHGLIADMPVIGARVHVDSRGRISAA
jgi:hypothetical protein